MHAYGVGQVLLPYERTDPAGFGEALEELKPFEQILEPDFRTTCRGVSFKGLYNLAAQYELSPAAPERVRHQFEIARHAYVYSWLYTPLCAAAEFYAILAAEHALRMRYDASPRSKKYKSEPGLKKLLEIAIAKGWLKDEGFSFNFRESVLTDDGIEYRPIPPERRRRPTEIVLELLPGLRNDRAHGQASMTLERVGIHLQRACEIINQLFPQIVVAPQGAQE